MYLRLDEFHPRVGSKDGKERGEMWRCGDVKRDDMYLTRGLTAMVLDQSRTGVDWSPYTACPCRGAGPLADPGSPPPSSLRVPSIVSIDPTDPTYPHRKYFPSFFRYNIIVCIGTSLTVEVDGCASCIGCNFPIIRVCFSSCTYPVVRSVDWYDTNE